MPSSSPLLSTSSSSRPVSSYSSASTDLIWEPEQEWIQIFDSLLKHPQGIKKGCSCDICDFERSSSASPRLSLPSNIFKDQRRKSDGYFKSLTEEECKKEKYLRNQCRGGSVDRMLGLESSRKQSSNDKQYLNLDEGSFLTQFSKVVPLPVGDLRELDSHLASVYTYLASRDWRKKIEGLRLMKALLAGGSGNFEQFTSRLKYLELPLENCVKDLRSQVVRETCVTVAYLAHELQYKVESFLLHLLPFLMKLIQNNSMVVSSSGLICIRFILQNTFCSRFLPVICSSAESTSSITRKNIFQFLEQVLHVWPIHMLVNQTTILQKTIKRGLVDGDQTTRGCARKSYWAFADHFPIEAERLLSSLEKKDKTNQESFDKRSERSRQSSIERSRESLTGSLTSSKTRIDLNQSSSHKRMERSNSAVDPATARRAAVRKEFSQNCRSRVQRSESVRRSLGHSFPDNGLKRSSSVRRSISQPGSRSSSPAWRTLSFKGDKKEMFQDKKCREVITQDNVIQSKGSSKQTKIRLENSKEELASTKRNWIDPKNTTLCSPRSLATEEWIHQQNFHFHENSAKQNVELIKKDFNINVSSDDFSLNSLSSYSRCIDQLNNYINSGDNNKRVEILNLLEGITSEALELSQGVDFIFPKLLQLTCTEDKEVCRAAEETILSLILCLPSKKCLQILISNVEEEEFPRNLTTLKQLEKVLDKMDIETVMTFLSQIMVILLKAYDNTESSVRKAAVNCMVVLHSLTGNSALQPFLSSLSVPKRKLLSLYILRHKQEQQKMER